jgi:tungstate transport system substrate-binding protein
MRYRRAGIAAICAVLLMVSCRGKSGRKPVQLLTTPDVAATGLPQQLGAAFSRQSAVPVNTRIVTADQLVAHALAGGGGAALVRDPRIEQELSRRGLATLRSVVASERFLLMGPDWDPARVREAGSAALAFRRIAAENQLFCSPLDVPVLRDIEHELWSAAHVFPGGSRKYVNCRGTAAEALDKASRLRAYTVSHPEAVRAVGKLELKILKRDVAMLSHSYVVLLLRPKKSDRNNQWFVEWMMSYRGREAVRALRGAYLFEVPGS